MTRTRFPAPGQGAGSRPHDEVGVGREHGPGGDGRGPGLRQGREARDTLRPIRIIPEEDPAPQPPHHDLVEEIRRIETGLAGHGRRAPGPRRVGTRRYRVVRVAFAGSGPSLLRGCSARGPHPVSNFLSGDPSPLASLSLDEGRPRHHPSCHLFLSTN